MHHPKETLIELPSNPSYSHLTEYRFDNLTQEQSPTTSRFATKYGVMKILAGFLAIVFVASLFVSIHGQGPPTFTDSNSGFFSVQANTSPITPFSTRKLSLISPSTPKPSGKGCTFAGNARETPVSWKFNGNITDECIPGVKTKGCLTWRMTNAIILKDKASVDSNCQQIMEFINYTSSSCNTKSQMQWMFPREAGAPGACYLVYTFNSFALKRASSNFNNSRTLMTGTDPGESMFEFIQNIISCTDKNPPTTTDAAILNIFTDITYLELCENSNFMSGFQNNLNKLISAGYIVKFFFLGQNLSDQHNINHVENVLVGCKYGNPNSYCEIVDDNPNFDDLSFYSICLDPTPKAKDSDDFNWQLLLIIGIPCVSLTICCIGFFVCCLKCAKLKMAMMRMNIFNNNERTPEEVELKRKWFAKRKMIAKDLLDSEICKDTNNTWSHFASANNYMDIQALASANKKDVWEIDTKNLLIQEDHLLGNGAFANVFKGIVKGKIPLLVVNNSLNLVVESENSGHFEAAIKKLPAHADEQNHLDFFHEIDFMKRLGHHPHVISMLGCVSNPYEPLIVVEYCSRGDLLKFLRRHKDYVLLNKTDDCPVEADMCLRIKDLVSIAWQVADGMSYLASKNFIHRDLAARNILLTKSLTAKISDFGLCRYMDSALYTAKGGRLPIKWMSVEALKLYEFSSKSDVWSFGVLLFEIFSMGDVPYPTVQQVDMLDHLLSGGRLNQPIKCPNEIFNIMVKCWAENPQDRPEFNEIRGEVTVMLNLDDESYGYLSVQSDDGLPKYTSLTMQDSKETAPCSSAGGSQEMDNGEYDSDHSGTTCAVLDTRLNERFGEEQGQEIKQIFCEVKQQMGWIKRVKSTNSNSTNQS